MSGALSNERGLNVVHAVINRRAPSLKNDTKQDIIISDDIVTIYASVIQPDYAK